MSISLRQIEPADYKTVIGVVNDWWGGRQMADMLPRLFFVHFRPTSFIAQEDNQLRGFLSGFVSQTYPSQAYIHFVGADPRHRGQGIGRLLYSHFFEVVKNLGCTEVGCVTSPLNKGSIAFHIRLGFEILPGDSEVEGLATTSNYDGQGQARVLFRRQL